MWNVSKKNAKSVRVGVSRKSSTATGVQSLNSIALNSTSKMLASSMQLVVQGCFDSKVYDNRT